MIKCSVQSGQVLNQKEIAGLMPKLICCRGIPASGKTTFARKWVEEDRENRVRVNRDDLRDMVDDGEFIKGITEKRILEIRDAVIKRALRSGYDVISDDTNLSSRVVRDLRKLATTMGSDFEVEDFTTVSLAECITRDLWRSKGHVGSDVITDMYNRYLKGRELPLAIPEEPVDAWNGPKLYAGTSGKPKAVIVDVDGTVALHQRDPYAWHLCSTDLPNQPVIDLIRDLHNQGYKILFFSGRNDQAYNDTYLWLEKHVQVPFEHLVMRKNGDERKDSIVKCEMFDEVARNNYDVKMSIDDRNSVVAFWRELGLLCLHIADGDF